MRQNTLFRTRICHLHALTCRSDVPNSLFRRAVRSLRSSLSSHSLQISSSRTACAVYLPGRGALSHSMPARNNTNQPQNNSFRRFCTAETCQYVYYCLRCVAARQSSRHLAYMQGARIKACGSFPPQIVLALTSSKNSRRGSRAAPLCGDPEAKSSENLLL